MHKGQDQVNIVEVYLQAKCEMIKYYASLIRGDATCKKIDNQGCVAGGGHCL